MSETREKIKKIMLDWDIDRVWSKEMSPEDHYPKAWMDKLYDDLESLIAERERAAKTDGYIEGINFICNVLSATLLGTRDKIIDEIKTNHGHNDGN